MSDVRGPVLLLGGRSQIGLEVVLRLIARGHRTVVLAARCAHDLETQQQVLRNAGATDLHTVEFDADDVASHAAVIDSVVTAHGPVAVAVVAFGILGDQARAETDALHAVQIVHTDYVAQVSVLTSLATAMRTAGSGELVVFSSVAGARVRRANYVYGSAKAGLDGFSTGLAAALHGSGVHLLLLRPGFVIGTMTTGMDPAPWSSTPEQVADATIRGLDAHKDIVWIPGKLRYIVALMRVLPPAVWRRLPR